MIHNIRICEMCKRPNPIDTLFCPACIKLLNELKKKGTPFKIGGSIAK
jgi:hypothetical protein